ncbi:MAG: hypothetical protein AAFS02_12115 [Pseudomonadota bacterium]
MTEKRTRLRRGRRALGVVALVAVLAFYALGRGSGSAVTLDDANEGMTLAGTNESRAAGQSDSSIDAVDAVTPGASECLTPEQLLGRRDVQQERTRILTVVAMGEPMRSYQGIGVPGLRALIAQGDTAAMVVLGRRLQLEALGLDPETAVTTLMPSKETIRLPDFERFSNLVGSKGRISEPDDVALAMEARELFYGAALKGRLFALSMVGQIDWELGEDALIMGWISQEAFDSLSESRRINMFPERIYSAAVWYIAPELNSGFLSSLRFPEPQAAEEIAARLAEDYLASQKAAGLPELDFGPSLDRNTRDLVELVCEQYRDALFEDY